MENANLNLSPMDKGMIRDVPVNKIPKGGFLDVNGFIVENGNLRVRPRWVNMDQYTAYDRSTYGRAVDAIYFTDIVGTQEVFILTENSVIRDTGIDYTVEQVIRGAVASPTPFTYNTETSLQWTTGFDTSGACLWISDGNNPIVKYQFTGNTWSEELTELTSPRSVLFHDNRLWIAGPTTVLGTMLRWSNLNEPDSLSTGAMWFPERNKPITRIKSMGQFLVIYFPDAIYVGQATGNPLQPYSFSDTNMNMLGLYGPHAITDWMNGHVFFSSRGIFWLRPDRIIEELPCPIFRFIQQDRAGQHMYYIRTTDISEDLYFIFPMASQTCERIVYYASREQAWTYWDTTCDMMYIRQPRSSLIWNDGSNIFELPDGTVITSWDETQFENAGIYGWNDFYHFIDPIVPSMMYEGKSYVFSDSAKKDSFAADGTYFELTTGDLDLEAADINKTIHRLRLRTDISDATVTHLIHLWGSIDGGDTWKDLGSWNQSSADETWRNFRLTGAEPRLKLTGHILAPPYEWKDLTLRIRKRGLEVT